MYVMYECMYHMYDVLPVCHYGYRYMWYLYDVHIHV